MATDRIPAKKIMKLDVTFTDFEAATKLLFKAHQTSAIWERMPSEFRNRIRLQLVDIVQALGIKNIVLVDGVTCTDMTADMDIIITRAVSKAITGLSSEGDTGESSSQGD